MSSLAVTNLSVAFGGIHALSDVSLAIDAGQIVGVIGPNGAGKTTLLNVICGVSRPDRGDVTLHGTVVTGWKPSRIAGLGLGRTFQASQLFPGMTVLENLMTGLHLRGRTGPIAAAFRMPSMKREEAEMRGRALAALDFVGMRAFAGRSGTALSFGQQRVVEIARALIGGPKILLLDEPAVGLSLPRIAELDMLLRRIRDERGVTLVMIEHVIRLVMGVSDRVIVMNSGHKIAEGSPDDIRRNPDVVEAYLGRHGDARRPAS
jgi:branched-chain amino acid transport system ATP-binding protein